MPAKSQAQRGFLNAKFGHAWVKEHHFDNKGPLPAHVGGKKVKKAAALPKDGDKTVKAKAMPNFAKHTSKHTGGMKAHRTHYQKMGPKHANEKHC